MTEKSKKWSDDAVATLTSMATSESPVSAATVEALATKLDVSARSVASKLRQLDYDVASMATVKAPAFTADQTDALRSFVESNAGSMTYKEIAEQFPGNFNAKQIQGKLLALELTGSVKPAEKIEAARTYSTAEEDTFIKMANSGKYIEEISVTLGKNIASVRGKALSLSRSGKISSIPAQKESHAKNTVDAVEALGSAIQSMTVAQIASSVDKTERGIKTILTRRGIDVADYAGATKKAKADAKATA